MSDKVLVLGGSGFVGSAIVRTLSQNGFQPIAGMRKRSAAVEAAGVEVRLGDAKDYSSLRHAACGVKYAVNSVLGPPAAMIAATRNLCTIALEIGLQTVVHLSSMAVYGPATGYVDELTPLHANHPYGRAKIECERIVRGFMAAGGKAVIIRPGCVYGPGGEQWVGRIARWLRSRRLGTIGALGEGICNLTFNDDLGDLVLKCLEMPSAVGETFNFGYSDIGTWNSYFVELGSAIGVTVGEISPTRARVEAWIVAPPLQTMKIGIRQTGLSSTWLPEPIPPSLLLLWRQLMWLDSRKADAILSPNRTASSQGIARSAEWFRSTLAA